MFRMRNKIKLSQLQPHPQNPRKHLDSEELANSINETGLLSPLIVRRIGNDNFEIISGHRRKTALEKLGHSTADCDVVEMTDEQAYKALMTANIQSQSLSEIEEAEGIKHMIDAYEWTQGRVAKEFGKGQVWVNRRLDLLNLEPQIQEQIITRVITATHGREIGQLPKEVQGVVTRQVVEEKLSTRETADLVKKINNPLIEDSSTEFEIQTESIDEIRPLEIVEELTVKLTVSPTNHQIGDQLDTELKSEFSATNPQFQGKSLPTISSRHSSNRIRASDYITKFYEFLANLDDETIDGIIELDETSHFLAVIDKAQDQLNWMRAKVTKSGETNIVEFRRKEA